MRRRTYLSNKAASPIAPGDFKTMDESHHSRMAPALSRPLAVTEVPPEGLDIEIVATESECAELAKLNALPAIQSLTATLRARRWRGAGLEVAGELRAKIRQTCVVTLEDFDSDIVEPIEMRFAPPQEPPRARSRRGRLGDDQAHDAHFHDPTAEDPPDPLVGGAVDLGAVVSEFLTLALDPYPRKPGAQFDEPAPASPPESLSPFARLRAAKGD